MLKAENSIILSRRDLLRAGGLLAAGLVYNTLPSPLHAAVPAESNFAIQTNLIQTASEADYFTPESGDMAFRSLNTFIHMMDPKGDIFDRTAFSNAHIAYFNVSGFYHEQNVDLLSEYRQNIVNFLGVAASEADPLDTAEIFFQKDMRTLAEAMDNFYIEPFRNGNSIEVTERRAKNAATMIDFNFSSYVKALPGSKEALNQGVEEGSIRLSRFWTHAGYFTNFERNIDGSIPITGLEPNEQEIIADLVQREEVIDELLTEISGSASTSSGLGSVYLTDSGRNPMQLSINLIRDVVQGTDVSAEQLLESTAIHESFHLKDVTINMGPLYLMPNATEVLELMVTRERALQKLRLYPSLEKILACSSEPILSEHDYISRRFDPKTIDDVKYAISVYPTGLFTALMSGSGQAPVETTLNVTEEIKSDSPFSTLYDELIAYGFNGSNSTSCRSLIEYLDIRKEQIAGIVGHKPSIERVFNKIKSLADKLDPKDWLNANDEMLISQPNTRFLPTLSHPLFRVFKGSGTVGNFDQYVLGNLVPLVLIDELFTDGKFREEFRSADEYISYATKMSYSFVDAELFAEAGSIANTVPDEILQQDPDIWEAIQYVREYDRNFKDAVKADLSFPQQLDPTTFVYEATPVNK